MQGDKPFREEIEFRHAELDAFEKRYGLEDFGELLDCLLTTIRGMIRQGEIPGTKEGVMKAMSLIVSEHPEIDQYLRKFSMAVAEETVNEIKQAEKPN
jgi:hypothetical protein